MSILRTIAMLHFILLATACTSQAADAASNRPPSAKPTSPERLDAARIRQLADMLPPSPRGVGPTIADRKSWDAAAKLPAFAEVVKRAERLVREPIPPLTDELFLDFSRTGNRTRCQRVLSQRHGRLSQLVLAECLEDRGRFKSAIEEAIREVCSEKTWVMPAHDRGLNNFRGKVGEIDLGAAGLAWNLATADYWLGDRLSKKTRQLIRDELERRIFAPFSQMVTTGKPRMWWLTTTNNWNAVCLAGVTGSALAVIPSPERRALFVTAAEVHIQNLMRGFGDDGYCSEGLGYWNYGFGHYVLLAETLHQATGGQIDWLQDAKVQRVARFGQGMEILPGVYPALADCRPGTRPGVGLTAFLSRRYELGLTDIERHGLLLAPGPSSRLFELGLMGFANSASRRKSAPSTPPPPRSWFAEAGVLICRPRGDARRALGVALKGGHNAEHHNHNDVGSFVVALGNGTPLVDPGSEVYTARTFSPKRYDSGVLNSHGHPVPRVAGQMQRSGRDAAAKIVKTQFSDSADTLVLDLRSAYAVKQLDLLQRTFIFSRQGNGRLTVADRVRFKTPESFGTALVTFSSWRRIGPTRLLVGQGTQAVRVDIDAGGRELRIHGEQIKEHLPGKRLPTRIGIDLVEPVREATITITIVPEMELKTE